MSEISGISGASAVPPSEPTRAPNLKALAAKLKGSIESFVIQLNQLDSNSASNPAEVKKFAETINQLHSNAMQATGNICSGCTSSNLGG